MISEPVWPKLTALSECLCKTITAAEVDPMCFCGIVPGVGVVLDFISSGCTRKGQERDGMAWVRLTTSYLTTAFPQPAVRETKCGAEVAFVAEIGIARSMPLGKNGEPPDAAMMQAAAERQVGEASIMRRAVTCCFGSGSILGSYTPLGPDGGAIGGFWLVSVPTLDL